MERESGASAVAGAATWSGGLLEHRQWQLAARAGLGEHLRRQLDATATTGAGTGAHGQLRHCPAAGLGRLADVVVGHPVADADVHVVEPGWQPFASGRFDYE